MSGDRAAQYEWLERVLGLRLSPAAASAPDGAAMQQWQDGRKAVVSNLMLLANEISKAEDPETKQAEILVKAIIANLTPAPSTLQSVVELERYLTQDEIIDDVEQPNPFGIALKLRATLLPAIGALRQQYATPQA